MEATDQIDRLIESRRQGREEANALAQLERAEDARRLREMRQDHKVLWVEHYRRLAASSLKAARDLRRRARELENQPKGRTA